MLDQPLPAGCVGSKGGDDDGGTNGGSRSRIAHLIGVVLLSPTQGGAAATRMAGSEGRGNEEGNYNSNECGK